MKKYYLIILICIPLLSNAQSKTTFDEIEDSSLYTLNIVTKDFPISKQIKLNKTLLFLSSSSGKWKIMTGESFGIPIGNRKELVIKLPKKLADISKIQLKNKNNDLFNYNIEKISPKNFSSNYEWIEISLFNKDNQIILTQSLLEILNK